MTMVEFEIIAFLKQNREHYFARKETSRKARHRNEYEADPRWAAAPLQSPVVQGHVVQNDSGHCKLSDTYDA